MLEVTGAHYLAACELPRSPGPASSNRSGGFQLCVRACDIGLPQRGPEGEPEGTEILGWQAFGSLGEVVTWAREVRSENPLRMASEAKVVPALEGATLGAHQRAPKCSQRHLLLSEGREGMWVWESLRGAPVAE